MEQLKFETSMENIPFGGNKEYVMQLTQSVRKVVYATQWNKTKVVILLLKDSLDQRNNGLFEV